MAGAVIRTAINWSDQRHGDPLRSAGRVRILSRRNHLSRCRLRLLREQMLAMTDGPGIASLRSQHALAHRTQVQV